MSSSNVSVSTRRTQAERREHTRGALIAATIRSLAEYGYLQTTTRRVIELAGSSPGALAHHFPSRLDLIAASLDEVGRRTVAELRERMAALPSTGATRTPAALDMMWDYFRGDLFQVWLRVWFAASEDHELYERLAPLERALTAATASVAADLAPPDLSARVWNRRMSVATDTMRGLALRLRIEPREKSLDYDPWPVTRDELANLLDRRATGPSED